VAAGAVFGSVGSLGSLGSWRRLSATGVMVAAVAFGLREALEERSVEAAVIKDVGDEPFGPEEAVEVHLEWGRPEDGWAVVRPWLLVGLEGGGR
jgi:hypothetical protein